MTAETDFLRRGKGNHSYIINPTSHRGIRETEKARSERIIAGRINTPMFWGPHDTYDSPLDGSGRNQTFVFRRVIPNEHYIEIGDRYWLSPLKTYIEKTLAPYSGEAQGLELGGQGRRFFAGFTRGFFAKTAGICLPDMNGLNEYDAVLNHKIIRGDMFKDQTRQEAKDWFGGKKLNFIIETLWGPQHDLPREPFFLSKQAAYWYDQLAVGGIFLAQIPPGLLHSIPEWETFVKRNHARDIEVQIDRSPDSNSIWNFVRINKLSSRSLPLLDAKSVLNRQRKRNNYTGTDIKR